MSKPPSVSIKGFLETSFLDWPGQVTAVLFVGGCNFRCPFCHNSGLVLTPDGFPDLAWTDIQARLARFKGWLDGVVITGGEPTLSPGLPGLIEDIRDLGFRIKLDTNGSRPEVLTDLLGRNLLNHVAMDIKAPFDDLAYARAIGRPARLDRIKASLEALRDAMVPYTLRTTVVPGLHSEADLRLMADQLAPDPIWRLQRFQPDAALDPEFRHREPMSQDAFEVLSQKIEEAHRAPCLPKRFPREKEHPRVEVNLIAG